MKSSTDAATPHAAGYAKAAQPSAQTITTDSEGIDAATVRIPVHDGELPAYQAWPSGHGVFPVLLVVHEIFGVHEHIKDVCRRLAKLGYLAIAPELFARQGDVTNMADTGEIMRRVVSQVTDRQVLSDLDATLIWLEGHDNADIIRLGITGFCWGGRIVWLYCAHNPTIKAAVAWYGRLEGERTEIDGQHRVSGIKASIQELEEENLVRQEEVAAIFVGHNASTPEGKIRTRRLFTTVNKKAKRISLAATIALDEDNGFAVVTRKIIDTHWLFEDKREHISYTSTGSIPASDTRAITSVVGLYEIVKELYGITGRKRFESERPSEEDIQSFVNRCINYLNELLKQVPEYKKVFVTKKGKAGDYRTAPANHLLFRPVGQRIFARAASLLIDRGKSTRTAIAALLKVDHLFNPIWEHLLWDPINQRMVTNKLLLAETQLLLKAGQRARNQQNVNKLKEQLKAIKNS